MFSSGFAEQPVELAGMRREHRIPLRRARRTTRRGHRPAKLVRPSASSTAARSPRKRREHHLPGRSADPGARADRHRVEAAVGQQHLEFGRGVDRTHHHGKIGGGIDGKRIPRRSHGDEAGAAAQRRHRGKPRRAGVGSAARHDDGMAAAVFVSGESGTGNWPRHKGGAFSNVGGLIAVEYSERDADLGDRTWSAINAARQKQMPGFLAKEGDASRRP